MDEQTRAAIEAARIVTKGALRTLRTELQVLTELLERLDQLDAQPGGTAHEQHRNGRAEVRLG